MATTQDASIGLVNEVTYKTGVTVTRFLEYVDESLDMRKQVKQGVGLRVGSRVARSNRRVVPAADFGGDITFECVSKGMGLLWQACLGAGTSTLVSGTTFQQVFTFADNPTSLTIQKGLVEAGLTVDAYTFLGCMVSQFEIDFPQNDVVSLKASIDAGDMTTATVYAAPSYAAEPVGLFQFAGGTISTGTLTAPTTIALASAATPVADVRSGTVVVNNNLTVDRFNVGGAGRKSKPTVGLRQISGSLVIEYDSTTFRDAVLNDTAMSLVLTWVTTNSLSSGFETLQVVIPAIKFDTELAKTNGSDLVIQNMSFQGLDNQTAAQPFWVVTRTADSAL